MAEVSFINCPICNEPDMRCETEPEGFKLITCVNHGCASNGGKMNVAAQDERERCALLADALATRFEHRAEQFRAGGAYNGQSLHLSWPLVRNVVCVKPKWLEAAKSMEAAARALRNAIATGCRKGWDVRKLPGVTIETRDDKIDVRDDEWLQTKGARLQDDRECGTCHKQGCHD